MLEFLQGFAYGLFLTCLPWSLVGLVKPRLALPTQNPGRFQVLFRYGLLLPFISIVLWMTSLWGGFGPSLGGWLAGLVAVGVTLPLERGWRRWRSRRRQHQLEQRLATEAKRRSTQRTSAARESGVAELDPTRPPADADAAILALCRAKQQLLDTQREDLAGQVDRFYTRYQHVMGLLTARFDRSELAFERSRSLISEVCLGAVDTFTTMAAQARGVMGLDGDYVRRRLAQEGSRLAVEERIALKRRLELIEETERRVRRLVAKNESALTLLDDTAVALARVETGRPQASLATDQAFEELRRFIEGAQRYSRSERH